MRCRKFLQPARACHGKTSTPSRSMAGGMSCGGASHPHPRRPWSAKQIDVSTRHREIGRHRQQSLQQTRQNAFLATDGLQGNPARPVIGCSWLPIATIDDGAVDLLESSFRPGIGMSKRPAHRRACVQGHRRAMNRLALLDREFATRCLITSAPSRMRPVRKTGPCPGRSPRRTD